MYNKSVSKKNLYFVPQLNEIYIKFRYFVCLLNKILNWKKIFTLVPVDKSTYF